MRKTSLLAALFLGLVPASAHATTHWYKNGSLIPQGKVIPINYYGTIRMTPVAGTTKDVVCETLDVDGVVENPVRGGAGISVILNFHAADCSQSGYCAAHTDTGILIKNKLPTSATTFNGYNGYNDETLRIGFLVRCGRRVAASFVGPTLRPYLSAGRYEVKAPPNLDFGGAPGTHYRTQYGDSGELELEGSKGTQIVRPEGYWGYLGYDAYKNDIITIRNDSSTGAVARKTSHTAAPPVLSSTGNLVTPQTLLGPAESFLPPFV